MPELVSAAGLSGTIGALAVMSGSALIIAIVLTVLHYVPEP